jgi:hypothetical protein
VFKEMMKFLKRKEEKVIKSNIESKSEGMKVVVTKIPEKCGSCLFASPTGDNNLGSCDLLHVYVCYGEKSEKCPLITIV